jgi:hypothetical protein
MCLTISGKSCVNNVMRTELIKLEGIRTRFRGDFVRFGEKPDYKGGVLKTILLKDIRIINDSKILTDHLWFNQTKSFSNLELYIGDSLEFDGRCIKYLKGFRGTRKDINYYLTTDYKISYPTRVVKLK